MDLYLLDLATGQSTLLMEAKGSFWGVSDWAPDDRSLMLVTALAPVIGYDKASAIAHHAMQHDVSLKAATLQLGFVTETEFDRIVDPRKMVKPYVASTR